jgi:CHAT domain-containing protein/Tfp pilus assembly protein PilF
MGVLSIKSIGILIALSFTSQLISIPTLLLESSAIAQTRPHTREGYKMLRTGIQRFEAGNFQDSLDAFRNAFLIFQETGHVTGQGEAALKLGANYEILGEYESSLSYYERAAGFFSELQDRRNQAAALTGLGLVYLRTGQYFQSLTAYQQALNIRKQVSDRSGEAITLSGIGVVYFRLGRYSQALDAHQNALLIRREQENLSGQATSLHNIGSVYEAMHDYSTALKFYQQSFKKYKESGNLAGEERSISSIASVYHALGQSKQAMNLLQQALEISRRIDDPLGTTITLNRIGQVYETLEDFDTALNTYQQALSMARELGNPSTEIIILENIASLLGQLNQPELAITFYKEAVNLSELIRRDITALPEDIQQSYTETVSNIYRELADLLLQQNRVLEAQQVLDLLKVQELDDYLRGVQRSFQTESGIVLREQEQDILQYFVSNQARVVALSEELYRLEQIERSSRTHEQIERIQELRQLQQEALRSFQAFLDSDEIKALVDQLRQTTGATNLELPELNTLRDNLRQLEQNAVVLYPLVLEDRLELVLVTANAPPIRRTQSVKREDLNRGIAELRSALQSPNRNAVTPAQQLYDWLIRPIENDLSQANVDTMIYAPDGQLRYIPIAALHDGSQWLAERFQLNNITAASIDDLDNEPSPELDVLAAAFSQGKYTIPIRNRTLSFSGLEFAGREVENLSQLIPRTEKRLNEEFDSSIVLDMNDFSIVHLATHATFNPGPPEDSFILFGDGSKATLTDIKAWNFPNVELIVLSACETAVGDVPLGNGEEILGFGYLMQLAGADAAIASLWRVSDGGTQALMDAFYTALKNGHTKAEALRLAQTALIESDRSVVEDERADVEIASDRAPSPNGGRNLSHPYYWAPFILIGNGL